MNSDAFYCLNEELYCYDSTGEYAACEVGVNQVTYYYSSYKYSSYYKNLCNDIINNVTTDYTVTTIAGNTYSANYKITGCNYEIKQDGIANVYTFTFIGTKI